ncbi:MAG: hypothetical protein IK076_01775 [Bacteroidales bacterium]|nr:hypothetical protein [Bacteroidales bacterium]
MKSFAIIPSILVSFFLLAACGPGEEDGPEVIIDPSGKTDPVKPEEPQEPEITLAHVNVSLESKEIHSISLSKVASYSFKLTTTGGDPYVYSEPLAIQVNPDYRMLEFEYTASGQVNDLQVFYCLGGIATEQSSRHYGALSATTSYKKFTADISSFRAAGWGKKGDRLRFDPGDGAGLTIMIRNIVVREMTAEEKAASQAEEQKEQDKKKMAERLGVYLSKEYPSKVTNVEVTSDKVKVEGTLGGDGEYLLAEICPWQDVTEMDSFPYATKIGDKSFSITLDRMVEAREEIDYDRVFSKWAVVKVDGSSQKLDSHARYADEVAPVKSPPEAVLKNKKGLGAGNIDLYYQDCKEMGCGSVTMNVLLNGFINGSGADYVYGGIPYAIGGWKAEVDRMVAKCKAAGVVVSAIILTPTESTYRDPENTGGYYTMPNLTTAKAFNMYAAALTYMASRYCQDDPGRIHHWIMHNEVDFSEDWTNMGDQPMMRLLDRYVKSMRICYNIVRQYDQNAWILGSYTHCWSKADGTGAPKEMLEGTVDYSAAEGDFRWGVAYHPYPQDLTKPAFWKNDTESTWNMDTKYVTFKNLEVIDKWIKLPENLYKGKTKRLLFLSENGTNSPSYSDSDLALQAAGGAWAWKKVSWLDGIDGIQWHNWADNKAEFGLRIGLRSFDEGTWAGLTPKPVWYVWKAAGSDEESTVFDRYLSTIGISSWGEIMHRMD